MSQLLPTDVKYPRYVKMSCPFCANTADVVVLSNTDYRYPNDWKEIPVFCPDLLHPTKCMCLPIFSCPDCNKRKEADEELQLTAEFHSRLAKGREAIRTAIQVLKNLERECD